jgi:CBS domain-containing membrane protein
LAILLDYHHPHRSRRFMEVNKACLRPSEDDLRAALKDMRTYVDITEKDLKKIYEIALQHAQGRLASQVLVKEAMSGNVVAVKQDADLHEAARLLSENRISGMPVVDENNLVIGVVSEADILVLAGMNKKHTFKDVLRTMLGDPVPSRSGGNHVKHVMSAPAITVSEGDDIRKAAKILDERRIKRLPVVDDKGKLVGIISRADIVKAMGNKG